jgi:glutamine synthetase
MDGLMLTREAIASIAAKHSLVGSLLPKLDPMQAGNGAHLHFSLWKASPQVVMHSYLITSEVPHCILVEHAGTQNPVFLHVEGWCCKALLAQTLRCQTLLGGDAQEGRNLIQGFQPGKGNVAEAFMAGILAHLPGLMVFTVPAPISYARLQAGCWSGAFQ